MFDILNLFIGIILSTLIALISLKKKYLTRGGAIMGWILSVILCGLGGKTWFAMLAVFFFTSSYATNFRKTAKQDVTKQYAKGGRRDAAQAFANAGIPAVLAIFSTVLRLDIFFYGAIAAFSSVTADTWATEFGVLSKTPPRIITSGKVAERGQSGAVSLLGLGMSSAGALLIGLTAFGFRMIATFMVNPLSWLGLIIIIPLAVTCGTFGSLVDSVFGATIQCIHWCASCQKETEKQIHLCGSTTTHYRGFSWFNNDMVNFISATLAALLSMVLYLQFS